MSSGHIVECSDAERIEFLESQIADLRRYHEAEKQLIIGKTRVSSATFVGAPMLSSPLSYNAPEAALRVCAKLWRKPWKRVAIKVFFRLLGAKIRA